MLMIQDLTHNRYLRTFLWMSLLNQNLFFLSNWCQICSSLTSKSYIQWLKLTYSRFPTNLPITSMINKILLSTTTNSCVTLQQSLSIWLLWNWNGISWKILHKLLILTLFKISHYPLCLKDITLIWFKALSISMISKHITIKISLSHWNPNHKIKPFFRGSIILTQCLRQNHLSCIWISITTIFKNRLSTWVSNILNSICQ